MKTISFWHIQAGEFTGIMNVESELDAFQLYTGDPDATEEEMEEMEEEGDWSALPITLKPNEKYDTSH